MKPIFKDDSQDKIILLLWAAKKLQSIDRSFLRTRPAGYHVLSIYLYCSFRYWPGVTP